ncbi:MAG: hypothetical protein ACO1RX_20875 [Candidatus Sericytochromatia bacterium]
MLLYWGFHRRDIAPEARDKLVLSRQEIPGWLNAVRARVPATEMLILSTCQRFEVYAVSADPAGVRRELESWAHDQAGLRDGLQWTVGAGAAQHLFAVAAGLDSLVVGETEILGQLRTAWSLAQDHQHAGPVLNGLVAHALQTGRQVRHQTAISQGRISLESLALEELATELAQPVTALRWLVLGAGQLGLAVLRQLTRREVPAVTLINRTPLAVAPAGVRLRPWSELERALTEADAVVVCTGAAQPVLRPAHLHATSRPLGIIDLGLPRNVASELAHWVPLWDLEGLHQRLELQREQRFESLEAAHSWLERGWQDYLSWRNARELAPFLAAVYTELDAISPAGLRLARRQTLHPLVVQLRHAPSFPAQLACRARIDALLANWRETATHGMAQTRRYTRV